MNTLEKLNPLIDADYLIYRIGFAINDTEPVEYALATVKTSLANTLDKFSQRQYHRLYLSGKDNFREKIATIQVYKGNRDPSQRPHYYQEIKDYLINVWDAEVVNGQEADDAVGIAQWAQKDRSTCIVGQDKDLHMIPGWHYNPIKGKMYYITLPEANEFFFKQMLEGDRTDNIPGIPKIGPKTAAKLIEPCGKDIMKMRDVVIQEYKKAFGNNARSYYKEISNLLWIRREENQVCPY